MFEIEEGKDSPNPPLGLKRGDSPAPTFDFRSAGHISRSGAVQRSESSLSVSGDGIQHNIVMSVSDDLGLGVSALGSSSEGVSQHSIGASTSIGDELCRPATPSSAYRAHKKSPSSGSTNEDEPSVRRTQSVDSLVEMSPSSSGSCSPTHANQELNRGVTLPHHNYVCANTFEKLKLIGRGDVGKVYLVRHRETDELYAMKTLDKQTMMRRKKIRRALTERDILEYVDHPFIVTLHWSFQSMEKLYLVMDYCAGGSLFRLMQHQPGHCFHEESVRFYAAEILLALEYLHLNGFIYRDLKMENVLVHASGHIMITDFDLSIKADYRSEAQLLNASGEIFATPVTTSHSFVGTAEYLAPEVICGSSNQSCSVDWWTYGILIYEGLYGHTPFQGKTTEQICAHILDGGLHFPDHHMYPVSNECKTLIKKLLDADPKKRLGGQHDAPDIKKHKFFDKISFPLIRNTVPPIIPKLRSPTDTSNHRTSSSKDDLTESDTDSELSEDEQLVGPFKDFKQVFQETRTKRTSLNDPASLFGRSGRSLRVSSGSIGSSSVSSIGSSSGGVSLMGSNVGSNLTTSTGSIEHPVPISWQQSSDPNLRRTASCNSMDEAEFWGKFEKKDHHHKDNHKENEKDGDHHHHHHHHHHHLHNPFRHLWSHHKK